MSNMLVYKPARVEFSRKYLKGRYKHIGVLYSNFSEFKIAKHSEKISGVDAGLKLLEKLTEYPVLAFFSSEKQKKFIRNRNNMPPIIINSELGYIGCGNLLELHPKAEKVFTDVFYINQFSFQPLVKFHPNLFFTYEGIWLLENIIPSTSSMAFMKLDGEVSFTNKENWENFKEMKFFDTDRVSKLKTEKKKK